MMNRIDFSTLVKRMTNLKHGIKNRQIMHPARDWFIGLFLGLVIFGVSAAWSAYVYVEYKNTSVEESAQEFNEVLYRGSQVDSALEYFRNKKKVYSSLVNSKPYEEGGEVIATSSDKQSEETLPIIPEQLPVSEEIKVENNVVEEVKDIITEEPLSVPDAQFDQNIQLSE